MFHLWVLIESYIETVSEHATSETMSVHSCSDILTPDMVRTLARAPGRVDPAGGGTDAPPFSIEHGGTVVNIGVSRHAFASVTRLPKGNGITIYSEDLGSGVWAPNIDELPGRFEFLEAFVRRLVDRDESLLLVTESDIPPGSGLGGSGAIGVAVVAAIDRTYGLQRLPEEIASVANSIEREDLGYPGGNQDSFGAAFGGVNRLEYVKGGGTRRSRVCISNNTLRTLEYRSLLIYTSEAHVSGDIHEEIKNSYSLDNSPTVSAMVRLREEGIKMANALEEGNFGHYVDSLNVSCHNLYQLHPSCDSETHRHYFKELDGLILGGKTCGAGGGGVMFVFTRPSCRRECIRRAESLGALVWPLKIDLGGVQTWLDTSVTMQEVEHYRLLSSRS